MLVHINKLRQDGQYKQNSNKGGFCKASHQVCSCKMFKMEMIVRYCQAVSKFQIIIQAMVFYRNIMMKTIKYISSKKKQNLFIAREHLSYGNSKKVRLHLSQYDSTQHFTLQRNLAIKNL